MSIFYINNIKDDLIEISGDDFFHITKSLRKKNSDEIICFNNEFIFYSKIKDIRKNNLTALILKKEKIKKEKFSVNLFVGLIKPTKFEYLIEKSVEAGVTCITPIITEYTQQKINFLDKKKNRWRKIIYEAVKQSHNFNIPEINNLLYYKDAVNLSKGLNLLFHPHSNNIFKIPKSKKKNINIFIGPEGGFSDEEIKLAKKNSFHIFKLPFNTILRTETACISGITLARNWLYGI